MPQLVFLNPAWIAGLAALSIPVIVHLINRKRARRWPFAALDWVMKSNRRTARRLKLFKFLTLAVRAAALAALALIFMRPILTGGGSVGLGGGPSANYILVDNSYSMLAKGADSQRALDRAKSKTINVLQALTSRDRAFVAPLISGPGSMADGAFLAPLDAEVRARSIEAEWTPPEWNEAVTRAYRELDAQDLQVKRIFLVTDRQRRGWDLARLKRYVERSSFLNGAPAVFLVDCGSGKDPGNIAVSHVRVKSVNGREKNMFEAEATLENHSGRPANNLIVSLNLRGEEIAQGFVKIPARGSTKKTFAFQFQDREQAYGHVSIGRDALEADDVRYFAFAPLSAPKVLSVDGSPGASPLADETYFFNLAVNPNEEYRERMELTVMEESGFEKADLTRYAAVALSNVRTVSREKAAHLREYVRNGGGLVFFLGENVRPDEYNLMLGDLLPLPLQRVEEKKGMRVRVAEPNHPLFKAYPELLALSVESASVDKWFQTRRSGDWDGSVLIALHDGQPLLAEKPLGRGRTAAFYSTADLGWNDLIIRPFFPPFVAALISHVSGVQAGSAAGETLVGQNRAFPLPASVESVWVLRPLEEKPVPAGRVDAERGEWVFTQAVRPGIYTFSFAMSEPEEGKEAPPLHPEERVAVNLDAGESDLTSAPAAEFKKAFGEKQFHFVEVTRGFSMGSGSQGAFRKELWAVLFLALFGLMALESHFAAKL